MKKFIFTLVTVFTTVQLLQAQGTTYWSNLGQTSDGSFAVASDSWIAAELKTGTNAGGYMLNSIQLKMTASSGNPDGFTVMLYTDGGAPFYVWPGTSLGTLNGSTDPLTEGVYTYTPASNLLLSPSRYYFIVLTAGTAVADGAYEWSFTGTYPADSSGGWFENLPFSSTDGLNWLVSGVLIFPQLSLNATPIPEPGILGLFILSGMGFLRHRRPDPST